jgi:hypothetical protein
MAAPASPEDTSVHGCGSVFAPVELPDPPAGWPEPDLLADEPPGEVDAPAPAEPGALAPDELPAESAVGVLAPPQALNRMSAAPAAAAARSGRTPAKMMWGRCMDVTPPMGYSQSSTIEEFFDAVAPKRGS